MLKSSLFQIRISDSTIRIKFEPRDIIDRKYVLLRNVATRQT